MRISDWSSDVCSSYLESGLIKDLGRWILWEAASRVAIWRREGLVDPDFRVCVNLAGAQLEAELPRTVRAILGYTQLPSRALNLELTENTIMANPREERAVPEELRRRTAARWEGKERVSKCSTWGGS